MLRAQVSPHSGEQEDPALTIPVHAKIGGNLFHTPEGLIISDLQNQISPYSILIESIDFKPYEITDVSLPNFLTGTYEVVSIAPYKHKITLYAEKTAHQTNYGLLTIRTTHPTDSILFCKDYFKVNAKIERSRSQPGDPMPDNSENPAANTPQEYAWKLPNRNWKPFLRHDPEVYERGSLEDGHSMAVTVGGDYAAVPSWDDV